MIRGGDAGFQSTGEDYSFSLRDVPKTTTIGSRVCPPPVLRRASSPLVFSNTVSLRDENLIV